MKQCSDWEKCSGGSVDIAQRIKLAPLGWTVVPEAESVKGCCAELSFGRKLSVDQNKSQGIQKVDLKHFKFNYHCSTFYKFVRQLL